MILIARKHLQQKRGTSAGDLDLPGGGGRAQQEQPQPEGDKLGGCLTTLEDLANKARAGNGVDTSETLARMRQC